ncbi:MAG: hypothetical protein NWQ28_14510, partial [Nodularia sp. (in: cyanobacteria)]|nr:hypothetical protein [Nodularia sp. (in: cyanobacteria)]
MLPIKPAAVSANALDKVSNFCTELGRINWIFSKDFKNAFFVPLLSGQVKNLPQIVLAGEVDDF